MHLLAANVNIYVLQMVMLFFETFCLTCLVVLNSWLYKKEVISNYGSTYLSEHEIGWLNYRCQYYQQLVWQQLFLSLEKRTGLCSKLRLCLSTSLICVASSLAKGSQQLPFSENWRHERQIKNSRLAKMGCVYAMIFWCAEKEFSLLHLCTSKVFSIKLWTF